MKLSRDLSGEELIKLLHKFGYEPTRQTGSQIRLTRSVEEEQYITIPHHHVLKIGTLNNILNEVASQLGISKQELLGKF